MKITTRYWGEYDTCPWGVDNKDLKATLCIYGKRNRRLICSDGDPVTKTILQWLVMSQKLSLSTNPAKCNFACYIMDNLPVPNTDHIK
jgi:hypothetical protein